jgi:hypothetical protein
MLTSEYPKAYLEKLLKPFSSWNIAYGLYNIRRNLRQVSSRYEDFEVEFLTEWKWSIVTLDLNPRLGSMLPIIRIGLQFLDSVKIRLDTALAPELFVSSKNKSQILLLTTFQNSIDGLLTKPRFLNLNARQAILPLNVNDGYSITSSSLRKKQSKLMIC